MKYNQQNASSLIRKVVLCSVLLLGGCFGQKQPDKITTSCFPFGMKTGLPTYEEEFEKLLKQKDPFKWKVIKIITDAETIEKAAFQLKAITRKPPVNSLIMIYEGPLRSAESRKNITSIGIASI